MATLSEKKQKTPGVNWDYGKQGVQPPAYCGERRAYVFRFLHVIESSTPFPSRHVLIRTFAGAFYFEFGALALAFRFDEFIFHPVHHSLW